MRANGGLQHSTAAISQAALSVTWASIWTGSHLDRSVELCCPLQCSMAHTSDPGGPLLWRPPLPRELGTEGCPLPITCNSCCRLNLLGLPPKTHSFLCIS